MVSCTTIDSLYKCDVVKIKHAQCLCADLFYYFNLEFGVETCAKELSMYMATAQSHVSCPGAEEF